MPSSSPLRAALLVLVVVFVGAVPAATLPGTSVCAAPAPPDEDAGRFQPGWSVREYGGRRYEIVVPKDLSPSRPCSLVLAISVNGRDDIARTFEATAADGWITCAPKTRFTNKGAGENWATNEGPELLDLVRHLRKVLPVGEGRVHAVAVEDWAGFFPFVAFAKDEPFVSACFAGKCAFRGGSPPDRARREMGVLVLARAPMEQLPADQRIVPTLEGKVRSAEFRSDSTDPASAYAVYWRGVMEGRFTPGRDLSFDWREPDGREAALRLVTGFPAPSLLYFFSRGDAEKAEAKALQNVTFLDPTVREAAKSLQPVKLDADAHRALFEELGGKATPAIVVVDRAMKPLGLLEGDVGVTAALRLLRRFAPRGKGAK